MEKKSKNEPPKIRITKVASFRCVYPENVKNIVVALAQAGRYVNITKDDIFFVVDIYEPN